MAANKPGVDALAEVRKVLATWQDKIMSERLSDTSKAMAEVAIAVAAVPVSRDGWLRQLDHVRQWFKDIVAHDKASADAMLPALMAKLEALQEARTRTSNLQ